MSHVRFSRRTLLAAVGTALALPRPAFGQPGNGSSAMAAAEEISSLEVIEHLPALYDFYGRMHPDAQAITPRHVVIGWYQAEFQPRDPEPAFATGVTFLDWTWSVTGVTYPGTAEVSYVQTFGDGSVESDVVRLVWHDGRWRWFFGRDRAWVDEQIQRFTQTLHVPQQGSVPYGLDRVVISDGMLSRLPATIASANTMATLETPDPRTTTLPGWATGQSSMVYKTDQMYPVGYVQVFTLAPGMDAATVIRAEVEERQEAPPFTLLGWNLAPGQAVPFARIEHFGSEAVGNARTVYWARSGGNQVAIISHVDDRAMQAIAAALIG